MIHDVRRTLIISPSDPAKNNRTRYAPINVKPLGGGGGRPGKGGGFDSSHRPVVGTFDRFNGLSSNILLTFSCYFDNPEMLCGGAFEQKLSAQFKCPAYARPPPSPSNLTLIGALHVTVQIVTSYRLTSHPNVYLKYPRMIFTYIYRLEFRDG